MNTENTNIAKRAFELSQQALEDGNYALAQTYILNAITHNSDLKYLAAYPTIIKKLSSSERDAYIEQAINLYTIALFNNPPEDILQIMSLIEDLKDCMVESSNADDSHEDQNVENNIFAEFESNFIMYSWQELDKSGKMEDITILTDKVNFLSNVIQAGEDILPDSLSDAQRKLLQVAPQLLQQTNTYIQYLGIKKSIEKYLDEVSDEMLKGLSRSFASTSTVDIASPLKKNYNVQFIVCRLQQVHTLLAQLWLFGIESILGDEYFKQMQTLQDRYAELEKKFLENESDFLCLEIQQGINASIKSADTFLNKINSAKEPVPVTAVYLLKESWKTVQYKADGEQGQGCDGKITAIIEPLQKQYDAFSAKIAEIPLKSKLLEMQSQLQELAKKINILCQKRYAAYQKKCAFMCRIAIEELKDMTFASGKDAREILQKFKLAEINEALITPETASILQMTKQQLESKLKTLDKVNFACKCVEAEKMKLEDF